MLTPSDIPKPVAMPEIGRRISLTESIRSSAWPVGILAGLTLIVAVLGILNSNLIFDDLGLPEIFNSANDRLGYLRGAAMVAFGDGLPSEYRTYGLSRLLQITLFDVFGNHAAVYAVFIAIAQGLTAFGIFHLIRTYLKDQWLGVVLAAMWLCAPFALTYCFHHYSYLILPCEILVGVAVAAERVTHAPSNALRRGQWMLAVLGGFALALTGEAHLPMAIVALLFFVRRPIGAPINRWLTVLFFSMGISLVVHYVTWKLLVSNPTMRPRFNLLLGWPTDLMSLFNRIEVFVASLPAGMTLQTSYLWNHTRYEGRTIGAAVLLAVVILGSVRWRQMRRSVGALPVTNPGWSATPNVVLLFFIAVTVASVVLNLFMMTLTNGLYLVYPRRYGYMPYTIACMGMVVLCWRLFRPRMAVVVVTALAAIYFVPYFELQLDVLPRVRREDKQIEAKVEAAHRKCPDCGILFATRFSPVLGGPEWNNLTPGLRGGGPDLDLIESPLVSYWVQALWAGNVSKISNFGWGLADLTEKDLALYLYRTRLTERFPHEKLIVITNASLIPGTVRKEDIRIDEGWNAYAGAVTQFDVEKGIALATGMVPSMRGGEAVTIDLGKIGGTSVPGVLHDKTYAAALEEPSSHPTLIAQYGLSGGENGVDTVTKFADPGYYMTNRNGNFVYQIDFNNRKGRDVDLRLDFMELWNTRIGVRRFAVDTQVDGGPWREGGEIDPFALAGNDPFALRMSIHKPKTVALRFRRLKDSLDIPFVQGIRVNEMDVPKTSLSTE